MQSFKPVTERNEKAFFDSIKQAAKEIKKLDDFAVIFHHDADGSASGAIAINALQREKKKVSWICLKQLYKENIPEIKSLGKNYLFVDFGSGQYNELVQELEGTIFILDHHQSLVKAPSKAQLCWPRKTSVLLGRESSIFATSLLDTANNNILHKESESKQKKIFHINPLLFGINGATELSGSGVTFFFAHELNKKNIDLSVLAIVGALGDMQDFNSNSELTGMNRKILDLARENNLVEVKKDLRLYGRVSRPLVSFLLFSSNPVLPELTAQEDNCKAFLQQLGIPLKDPFTEKWLTYNDLPKEKQRELTTALILLLSKHNVSEWKIKELVGEVYAFPKENKQSPLSDGKEFATLLNACSRNKRSDIALAVCMGDRKEAYKEALLLMEQHRENLRKGIEFVQKNGINEKKSFYFIDAGTNIDESIVGVIAGMLYGSLLQETKPIIALARNSDGTIKVSGRATSYLVKRGINIGKALKEISLELQGIEGGGHEIAAGAKVQENKLEEFLFLLEKKFEEQLKQPHFVD